MEANLSNREVGRVEAKRAPVAIGEASLGTIDGRLGRSFPSRFDVAIESVRRSLRSTTAGAPR